MVGIAERRDTSPYDKIVVCASLFGADAKYRGAAIQCAEEVLHLRDRFPGLLLAIYYDSSVPEKSIVALASISCVELVYVESPWVGVGTVAALYRFKGFEDYRTAKLIVTYDLDNKINADFFIAIIENALAGDSIFYFLKKSNAPRGRPFNADCWIAIPKRSENYIEISQAITRQFLAYIRPMHDTDYGCDERVQRLIVENLRKYHRPEARIFRFYKNQVSSAHIQSSNYDDTQRAIMCESEVLLLENKWVGESNNQTPSLPSRQVVLS
jgi:hypothetical protein